MSHTLRFFREGQDPGDPRRADVHINFERAEKGSRVTGWAATVHPDFLPLIAAAPALLEACEAAEKQLSRHIKPGHINSDAHEEHRQWVLNAVREIVRAALRDAKREKKEQAP